MSVDDGSEESGPAASPGSRATDEDHARSSRTIGRLTWVLVGLTVVLVLGGVAAAFAIRFGWRISDQDISAWATVVLALVTVVLAGGTIWYAKTASEQVALEREQLKAVESQIALTERQFRSADEAARARLTLAIVGLGQQVVRGRVVYVWGSEPAYDVAVWVRTWDGLFAGKISSITPTEKSVEFWSIPERPEDLARPGVPELQEARFEDAGQVYAVIRWQRPTGEADCWHGLMRATSDHETLV